MVAVEAEMGSINSGDRGRDEHMVGPDFFDTAAHPQMNFRSTSIVEAGSGYTMTGDLTIKGITHPVTFDVTFNGSNTFPMDQLDALRLCCIRFDQPKFVWRQLRRSARERRGDADASTPSSSSLGQTPEISDSAATTFVG